MSSTGVNRETGKVLRGFDHVTQSIGVILTTRLGERIHREWVGFPGFAYLGESLNQQTIVRMLQLISITLTLRQLNGLAIEPRFRIIQMTPIEADRAGHFQCRIDGEYIPRGHLGDPTPESKRTILLSGSAGIYSATELGGGTINGTTYV